MATPRRGVPRLRNGAHHPGALQNARPRPGNMASNRARGAVSVIRVLGDRPRSQHALHDPARAWPETNCYVDLWIEVLDALGLDPIACFGFTFSTDFEGDQWTFFKPSFGDIWELYG